MYIEVTFLESEKKIIFPAARSFHSAWQFCMVLGPTAAVN